MIVDSRATTGEPAASAAETSVETMKGVVIGTTLSAGCCTDSAGEPDAPGRRLTVNRERVPHRPGWESKDMKTYRTAIIAAAAAILLLVAGCSSGGSTSPSSGTSQPPAASASASASTSADAILIKDFTFMAPASVAPGATVTVTNTDSQAHTVTSDDGASFDVTIQGGATATFTAPSTPGSFAFHCTFHRNMHATLVVK
ncbi:cupredoxin domain-containing protein [Lacisediminihabitans profunda]